jgi:hypothetical protein
MADRRRSACRRRRRCATCTASLCGRRRGRRSRTLRRAPASPPRWPSLARGRCSTSAARRSSACTSREGRPIYTVSKQQLVTWTVAEKKTEHSWCTHLGQDRTPSSDSRAAAGLLSTVIAPAPAGASTFTPGASDPVLELEAIAETNAVWCEPFLFGL